MWIRIAPLAGMAAIGCTVATVSQGGGGGAGFERKREWVMQFANRNFWQKGLK